MKDGKSPRIKIQNLVDGKKLDAMSGAQIEVLNPATGAVIATIPRSSSRDVQIAVTAAQNRLRDPAWSQLSPRDRAHLCHKVADLLEKSKDELSELESLNAGKALSQVRNIEVPRAIKNFRFFADWVMEQKTPRFEMEDATNEIQRSPVGVVGLITPWNLPLYLLSWKTAPALMLGNTIVAKPSELTPLTASRLGEIILEAGFPPGVFNLIHGTGAEAGQPLTEHPHVPAISFTGGTNTGKSVALAAAPHFKKISLELGGKNPTLVFSDCNLEQTIPGIVRAAFLNQGQVCLCGSRIFIERPIYETVRDEMLTELSQWKVGHPSLKDTRLGPLISEAQRNKVESYVEMARKEGGKILCGGKRPNLAPPLDRGFYYEPTLIEGLSPGCAPAREEIFGPVATLHPFDTEEEAIALANDVDYGLSASIWTENLEFADQVARSLDTGMVWINTWLHRDLRVPFGGTKHSGVGREGGDYSLRFFSEDKNICTLHPRGSALL